MGPGKDSDTGREFIRFIGSCGAPKYTSFIAPPLKIAAVGDCSNVRAGVFIAAFDGLKTFGTTILVAGKGVISSSSSQSPRVWQNNG